MKCEECGAEVDELFPTKEGDHILNLCFGCSSWIEAIEEEEGKK